MKAIKQIFCMLICASLICATISCKTQTNKDLLDTVLTTEEQQNYGEIIESASFDAVPWAENISYYMAKDGLESISAIGIKGLPVLIYKTIEIEDIDYLDVNDETEVALGDELARFRLFVFTSMLRVDNYSFSHPIIEQPAIGQKPSEDFYGFWKYAKAELPKISSSDVSIDEKLDKYVEFGLFAVPYVKEEIAWGQSEYEKYFALVGAHLTTADYMKVINSTDTMTPIPTVEEVEKSLLESGKDFDYKKWLNENEEDLNNLYKFLDEYVKDYESKTE